MTAARAARAPARRVTGRKMTPDLAQQIAREVLIALGQFQDGEPVDQSCPHCAQPISVDALIPDGQREPTAWLTRCPCGMCSGTFRGA